MHASPPPSPQDVSAGAFFALVLGLSLPFWLLGAVVGDELMPGLPISSLMVASPLAAGIVLQWRAFGVRGVPAFLARAGDLGRLRSPAGVAALVLINPVLYAGMFLVQVAIGVDPPTPEIRLGSLLILFGVFLVAALAEELGWTGHVLEPLERRIGAVGAGVVIGVVWAAWHWIPLTQADRSLAWIAWWTLGAVSARVLMVGLYTRTGRSVFGLSLFHAISNLCWQAYPVRGSFFDPQVIGLLTVAAAVVVVLAARPRAPS